MPSKRSQEEYFQVRPVSRNVQLLGLCLNGAGLRDTPRGCLGKELPIAVGVMLCSKVSVKLQLAYWKPRIAAGFRASSPPMCRCADVRHSQTPVVLMVSTFHNPGASKNHGRQPKCRAVTIKRAWSGLGTITLARWRNDSYFRVGLLARRGEKSRTRSSERGSEDHENGRFADPFLRCRCGAEQYLGDSRSHFRCCQANCGEPPTRG